MGPMVADESALFLPLLLLYCTTVIALSARVRNCLWTLVRLLVPSIWDSLQDALREEHKVEEEWQSAFHAHHEVPGRAATPAHPFPTEGFTSWRKSVGRESVTIVASSKAPSGQPIDPSASNDCAGTAGRSDPVVDIAERFPSPGIHRHILPPINTGYASGTIQTEPRRPRRTQFRTYVDRACSPIDFSSSTYSAAQLCDEFEVVDDDDPSESSNEGNTTLSQSVVAEAKRSTSFDEDIALQLNLALLGVESRRGTPSHQPVPQVASQPSYFGPSNSSAQPDRAALVQAPAIEAEQPSEVASTPGPPQAQSSDVVTAYRVHSVFADRPVSPTRPPSASEFPTRKSPPPQRQLPRVVPFNERLRHKLPLELAIGQGKQPNDPTIFYPTPPPIDLEGNSYAPDSPHISDEFYSYKDDLIAGSEITEYMARLSLNNNGYERDEQTCFRCCERLQAARALEASGSDNMDWASHDDVVWICHQNDPPASENANDSAAVEATTLTISDAHTHETLVNTDNLTPERFCAWLEWFTRPPSLWQHDWRQIADLFGIYCNYLDSTLWRPENLRFANIRDGMDIDIVVDPNAMEVDEGFPDHAAIVSKHFGDANDTTLSDTDIWAILVSDAYRDLRNMYTVSIQAPGFQDEPVFQRARRGFRQLNRMLVSALPAECRLVSWILP